MEKNQHGKSWANGLHTGRKIFKSIYNGGFGNGSAVFLSYFCSQSKLPVMSPKAVIDLGTNTCNLLIAKPDGRGDFITLLDNKFPVKMGRGGIHKKMLLPDAVERGIMAFENHAKSIKNFGVEEVRIVATSAIRGATNRELFIAEIKNRFGWEIEVIDGKREAELIFIGATRMLPSVDGKYLIVDIGGGSNEFILAEHNKPIWKKSFNMGVARTLEHFHVADPPSTDDICQIEAWYDTMLTELFEICRFHCPKVIVGCSGAFDTFMDIWEKREPDATIRTPSYFPMVVLSDIQEKLIGCDAAARSRIPGMDRNRVEMVVIAAIFTRYIIQRLEIEQVIHTHFALKEGLMSEWLSIK